jgi:hypothetical protein
MKPLETTRRHLSRLGVIALVVLFTVILSTSGLSWFLHKKTGVESLQTQCRALGISVKLGREHWTLWSRSYTQSRWGLSDTPNVSGRIEKLSVTTSLRGNTYIRIDGLELTLRGEPADLLPRFEKLVSKLPQRLEVSSLNVHYEHAVVGKVLLRGVTLARSVSPFELYADEVSVGTTKWYDIPFAIRQRGDVIETALGGTSFTSAKLRLTQIGTKQRGWLWTLHVSHQPLNVLLGRLHWHQSPILTDTNIGGAMTLVVEPNTTKPFGHLQLTFDNWPRPALPEAETLLGHSGSLLAELVVGATPFEFELPHIETRLARFSPAGRGTLSLLGPTAGFFFDISDKRNCAQLNTHLPPSNLRDRVAAYLEHDLRNAASEVQLRLKLDAAASTNGRHVLAAEQSAGCGLAEQSGHTQID